MPTETRRGQAALFIIVIGALFTSVGMGASLSEPATVFYGKVIATGSPNAFVLTEGELEWTIAAEDERVITLRTRLEPLMDGEYSYRLDVPHEALALGLETSDLTIPLATGKQTHAHLVITVNGMPTTILGPSGSTFSAMQLSRAATHRLDLEVGLGDTDSDGDGMSDRWEDEHGLNKQDASDGDADLDGDGLTNLQEFLGGSDPNGDDREPKLRTRELMAYAGATSALLLEVSDVDSDPASIIFTLDALPAGGILYRRNGREDAGDPEVPVAEGARFSLQEVRRGLLTFVPDEPLTVEFDSLALTVEDEDPEHEKDSATVKILFYQPDAALVDSFTEEEALAVAQDSRLVAGNSGLIAQRFRSAVLGARAGYVIRDPGVGVLGLRQSTPTTGMTPEEYEETYRPSYGSERSHVLMDTFGDDVLEGGVERDLLTGGRGSDTFTGDAGPDDFIFYAFDDRSDTVTDFNPADGDRIVLNLPQNGDSTYIDDFVRVSPVDGDLLLEVDLDGGGEYDDGAIRFLGNALEADFQELWNSGRLLADGFSMRPYLEVEATAPLAYEGGSTGMFTITRYGDPTQELQVELLVTGSAINGVDYQLVGSSLTIPAGDLTVTVPIVPFLDSELESLGEVVQLDLLPGSNYTLRGSVSSQLVIRDPIPVISISALAPVASQQDGLQGALLLTRGAAVNEQTLVSLELGGSATNGVDYDSLSSFVVLQPGETLRVIPVVPRPGSDLRDGAETLQVRVLAQSTYLLGASSYAEVVIVEKTTSFAQWVAENFPEAPADLEAFGATDPGGYGVPVSARYAFGGDALVPSPLDPGSAEMVDGHLTISIGVRPEAIDLNFVPQISVDGTTWNVGPSWVSEVMSNFGVSDPRRKVFRAVKGVEDLEGQLMRVRVEQN